MCRLLFLTLTVSLAILAGYDAALANWRAPTSPQGLLVNDPVMLLRRAESSLSNPEKLAASAEAIRRTATTVLYDTPLNPMAMRQLGIVDALAKPDEGKQQLELADRISRRDLPTQFLLIEQATRDGDVSSALSHYDRALSVSPSARPKLFSVLAAALDEPEIRIALTPYAARPWFRDFLGAASELGAEPAAVVTLLSSVRRKISSSDAQAVSMSVVKQLIERGQFATARDIVRQLPGNAKSALDELGFSAATTDVNLAPLSWTLRNDDSINAILVGNGNLAISVVPEHTSLAADRSTLIAPGDYDLTLMLSYDANTPRARLGWKIMCLGDASRAPLWQQVLPVSTGALAYRARITVPVGCEMQHWQLQATADISQFPSMARIAGFQLTRR